MLELLRRRPLTRVDGFREAVLQLAVAGGWRLSDWEKDGFVDAVLVRRGRLLFVELKEEGRRMRPGQHDWLYALSEAALAGGAVEVYSWRPGDWLEICEVLR